MNDTPAPDHTPAAKTEKAPPVPPPAPTPAAALPQPVVPAAELSELSARVDQLRAELDKLTAAPAERPKPKDNWDRLGLVAGALATAFIGVVGIMFTTAYQRNQVRQQGIAQEQSAHLQQLDAVSKFMPYLAGQNEEQKELAIVAIYSAGGAQVSSTIARLHPSIGARNALQFLQQNALAPSDRAVFAVALQNFPHDLMELRPADGQNFSPAKRDSLRRESLKELGLDTLPPPRP